MLNVTPTSWISGLYPFRVLGTVDRYMSFVALTSDYSPITFSNKPETGKPDEVGNRPCLHTQFHGDVVMNDTPQYCSEVFIPRVDSPDIDFLNSWVPEYAPRFVGQMNGWTEEFASHFMVTQFSSDFDETWVHLVKQFLGDDDIQFPDHVVRFRYGCDEQQRFYCFSTSCRLSYQPSGPSIYAQVDGLIQSSYEPDVVGKASTVKWYTYQRDSWNFTPSNNDIIANTKSWTFPAKSTSGTQSFSHTFRLPPMTREAFYAYLAADPVFLRRLNDEISLNVYLWKHSAYRSGSPRAQFIPQWRYKDIKPYTATAKEIRAMRRELQNDLDLSEPKLPNKDQLLGDSTSSAADAAKSFDGNLIAYAKEAKEMKDTISGIFDLFEGEVNLKKLSAGWLQSRYGLRLTYHDTVDLLRGIKTKCEIVMKNKNYYSSCRGVSRDGDTICHCKLYYRPDLENFLEKILATLVEWDAYPNLENIWDLIPYSFVVDWFTNVGEILNSVDNMAYLDQVHVFATCYTIKKEWISRHVGHKLGLVGEIRYSKFERLNPKDPYQYVPHFDGKLPSNKNIIDGAALIIQRS